MPEEMQVERNTYCVDVTGAELFRAVGIDDLPVYACIAEGATEEAYEAAVELLKRMIE